MAYLKITMPMLCNIKETHLFMVSFYLRDYTYNVLNDIGLRGLCEEEENVFHFYFLSVHIVVCTLVSICANRICGVISSD